MSATISVPEYKGLTGAELKAIILKRIGDAIDASGKFDPHLTFPNLQFYWNLQVRMPITTDRNFAVELTVDEVQLSAATPAETVSLTDTIVETNDNPADAIRNDNELPVVLTEVGMTKGGIPTITERVQEPRKRNERGHFVKKETDGQKASQS